ncbi:solute carrier family 49 member 4 homolog [Amphiura filiformis]|uniref:solute carrier family 49 member 4 homolog n=1 Tax=Amphiura filiformis TaxID=82378 RepID=UPI003B219516
MESGTCGETTHLLDDTLTDLPASPDLLVSLNSPKSNSNPIVEYRLYTSRWYVLFVFVLLAASQLCLWNTFGPIADTAKIVLGWTDSDIALITSWGCTTFVLSAFFYSWLMDVKGLKVAVTLGAACLFVGTGIRCLPIPLAYIKWVMHLGQIVIGFAGPVMMAAPALLSATWFPPHQRITSTAIAASASYLGPAVAYLICPAFVGEVHPSNNSTLYDVDDIDPVVKQHHVDEINTLMYVEFGVMALLFLCVLIYFPAKPQTPPSPSAHDDRHDFKPGLLILVKNIHFWLPALCYSISNGVFYAWQSQLVLIFKDAQSVGQDTSGWIGFYANIAGVIGAITFGRLIDHIGPHGKIKSILIILVICCIGLALWFGILCLGAINFNIASLYISVPLYFEMTIEGMYPVAEGIITGFMTWLMNLVCLTVLLILMFPSIGVSWMNWAALGGVSVGLPLLLCYKEEYNRLSLDAYNRLE